VRVVASIEANSDNTRSNVSVNLDGTALASGSQNSPTVGPYTSVTAGSHQIAVSLNAGAAFSTTTQSFTAGGDYTLMAYGSQAAPVVTLLTDNNSVPAINRISLRLVNGDDTAGPVTLLVDNGNVFIPDIAAGTASSYVAASSTGTNVATTLEVDSQSTFGALYQNDNQNFLSQGVYTVFLLRGGVSTTTGLPAPTGVVRKDR